MVTNDLKMQLINPKTSFLIISVWNNQGDLHQQFAEIKQLFDNQHVEMLFFSNQKRPKVAEKSPNKVHVIYKSDMSIFGKIKRKNLLPTTHTHFDVAILRNTFNKQQDKLIKQLAIKYNVAFNYERSFVNINLSCQTSNPTDKLKFALNTLSKISD